MNNDLYFLIVTLFCKVAHFMTGMQKQNINKLTLTWAEMSMEGGYIYLLLSDHQTIKR